MINIPKTAERCDTCKSFDTSSEGSGRVDEPADILLLLPAGTLLPDGFADAAVRALDDPTVAAAVFPRGSARGICLDSDERGE